MGCYLIIIVVDGIMTPPKDVHVLNHGIYECVTSHCTRDYTDVIKVKNFEMRQLSCTVNHISS